MTRLGDIDSRDVREPLDGYNFSSYKIMKLRGLKSISPKIRLYFRVGFPMKIVAQTTSGPLVFYVKCC